MRKFGLFVLMISALLPAGLAAAQKDTRADAQLQAAIEFKETVEGDLKSAIEMYRKVSSSSNRPAAAKALVRMGQCYEKLGDAEARKTYERVVREFGDQKEAVEQARGRVAALEGGHREPATVTMRRVSDGREPDNEGRPSPDGQWLSYTSPEGDLGIYNLLTGEKRIMKRNQPNPSGKRGWVRSRSGRRKASRSLMDGGTGTVGPTVSNCGSCRQMAVAIARYIE